MRSSILGHRGTSFPQQHDSHRRFSGPGAHCGQKADRKIGDRKDKAVRATAQGARSSENPKQTKSFWMKKE
jgi:hypothetical protein